MGRRRNGSGPDWLTAMRLQNPAPSVILKNGWNEGAGKKRGLFQECPLVRYPLLNIQTVPLPKD